MFTKLTLRLEKDVIEEAKAWADEHEVSLSNLVAMLFRSLGTKKADKADLTPWTRRMLGAARVKGKKAPSDREIRDAYTDHLEKKHS